MKSTPILFYSDSPDLHTGLGRITKDLAILTCSLPDFRVATYGRCGRGSSKLPFAQYNYGIQEQWGEERLGEVWNDFAGAETGIIFTIMDPSRITWFSTPRMGGPLQRFLQSGRFKRWGYFPVDAPGVGGRLTAQCAHAVHAYDRVLAYTLYGQQILENTIGRPVDWLPHGYGSHIFQPRDKAAGRAILKIGEEDTVIGMVGTNQARKEWGIAFESIAILRTEIPNLKFWAHVDTLERYWSIPRLVEDFDLADVARVTITGDFNSEQLSYMYSTCDVTMLASSEGFGYPLVESMACGVPVVHGDFGGGAELIPDRNWLAQ